MLSPEHSQQQQGRLKQRHDRQRAFSSTAEESSSDEDGEETKASALSSKPDIDPEEVESKRRKVKDVPIREVLDAKHAFRWINPVIREDTTIREAIKIAIEGGLSGMMVIQATTGDLYNEDIKNQRVVGLLTSRDILRMMAASLKEGISDEEIMGRLIGDYMTPISQVIYGRPTETIGMCRSLMGKLGIKCLPILSDEGKVEGLITSKDMNDFGLSASDKGGKKAYLNDMSERVGLSSDTSMAEPPTYMHAHLALQQKPLATNVGTAELPHPYKTHDGVGHNRRDHGPQDLATDLTLSEDAHFSIRVNLEDETDHVLRDVTYFGVADGVGSWRQYGVDPRLFSHKLMEECENILLEACHRHKDLGGGKFRRVIPPGDILAQAYERVKAENIIGSSTACVALFDCVRHQLHFSNLGDSGIIVLRHIDSDIAGTLKRDRITPRAERTSDLRVAFISQQQLFSFNHPYQLGWTGKEVGKGEASSFKAAQDSCTTSIHIRRGDIVIMATDGLFDNVDIDDVVKVALKWEQGAGLIEGNNIAARDKRWATGDSLTLKSAEAVEGLANELCELARENSLDSTKDSPFAMLAKDNDIMWSGGMPDDCTVIVAHVVGQNVEEAKGKK
eukprot:CAMPEP_0116088520 /NCGR_PEP_ID=MMETSP0327-20121206/5914_1 /TAXON_ID=44447 /ORGANISM="Pseudo-nitzschia delicatissima, Strain B596" /LENGTH=618 /DNA_ID=CAMNT_0003579607 /DNA_START=469 /DNA_END=2325 /DNA_ORIENTATION=-